MNNLKPALRKRSSGARTPGSNLNSLKYRADPGLPSRRITVVITPSRSKKTARFATCSQRPNCARHSLQSKRYLRMAVGSLAIVGVRQYFAAFTLDVVVQPRHTVGIHERLEPLVLRRAVEHQKAAAPGAYHLATQHRVFRLDVLVQPIDLIETDLRR